MNWFCFYLFAYFLLHLKIKVAVTISVKCPQIENVITRWGSGKTLSYLLSQELNWTQLRCSAITTAGTVFEAKTLNTWTRGHRSGQSKGREGRTQQTDWVIMWLWTLLYCCLNILSSLTFWTCLPLDNPRWMPCTSCPAPPPSNQI